VRTDDQVRLATGLEKARGALEEFRRGLFLRRPELQVLRGRSDPASLADLNASLFSTEPGLCVLAYLAGDQQTYLFVLTAGRESAALAVHRIPIPLETLRAQVRSSGPSAPRSAASTRSPDGRSTNSSSPPPGQALDGASHLVIVPDGPLNGLPFPGAPGTRRPTLGREARRELRALGHGAGEDAGDRRGAPCRGDPKLVPILAMGAPVMPEGFRSSECGGRSPGDRGQGGSDG